MNYSPDQIYSAAAAIQPYISELLSAPNVQSFAVELERLLAESDRTSGPHVELARLLSRHETVKDWVRLYLEEGYAADEVLKALRVYFPLPGLKHPIESPRYVCPVEYCHQDWYRQQRDVEIPSCPVHGLQLVIDG